jgi:hypothetical protein
MRSRSPERHEISPHRQSPFSSRTPSQWKNRKIPYQLGRGFKGPVNRRATQRRLSKTFFVLDVSFRPQLVMFSALFASRVRPEARLRSQLSVKLSSAGVIADDRSAEKETDRP